MLFTVENVGAEDDWLKALNPNSLEVVKGAIAEPFVVSHGKVGDRVQFDRTGYFVVDPDTESSAHPGLVFNRVVTLKEAKDKQVLLGKQAGMK